jgi:hypothetical protein
MNERHGFGAAAVWAAPLLAGCVLTLESSPENDEYWDGSGSRSDVTGRADGAPSRGGDEVGGSRPPLTPESGVAVAPSAPEAAGFPQDEYRDLIVIDPEIVGGSLASSSGEGAPFSFRAQMQWLAGASREPLEFTRAWLHEWEHASEVGPEFAPVSPRPQVGRILVDAWLAASDAPSVTLASASSGDGDGTGYASSDPPSAEAGDEPSAPSDAYADSSEPTDTSDDAEWGSSEPAPDAVPPSEPLPSWAYSPFRLIAIVNRVDLAQDPCQGDAGELRYVYAAVDPATSRPLDLTLIVEVPYPTTRSAAEWARAWRALAELPAGEPYAEGLADLTREIQREGDPLRVRLRTNEVAFADPAARAWEMREFNVQIRSGALALALVPLEFTPRADVDPAVLSDYVLEHADEIEGSGASLPESLQAGAAQIDAPDFSWPVLGVSERLRRAFSLQTCNGCHGGDTATLPFRHIGAGSSAAAPAQLSRFLYDPSADSDELRRRSGRLETLAATECAPSAPDSGYSGG